MTTYEIVAGTTAVIDVSLYSQGDTPAGTMVGMTAALVLADIDGNAISTSGDVTITDTTEWTVRYSPDAADLTPGTYRGRFKITDSGGLIAYFPSGEPDVWIVRGETS